MRERVPALAEMARSVANIRVRTAGTLGGNLCFGDPHSDPGTFLLAAGAEAVVRRGGAVPRVLAIGDFMRGPYETALGEGDLLVSLRIPETGPGEAVAHHKLAFRERPAATVAVWVRSRTEAAADARIAVGSVGRRPSERATPRRSCSQRAPAGEVTGAAAQECNAVADANGSEEYKRQLVRVLVGRALAEALQRAG